MAKTDVSKQMLLDGAQMMLSTLMAGTMGFLKQQDIPIKDWVAYIGEAFEESWSELEGQGAGQIMQHLLALQILPLGVEVTSSQMTDDRAEVTVTPLPSHTVLEKFGSTPKDLVSGFGVTPSDFGSVYGIHDPAAKAIGLRFTHQLKNGQQLLRLERISVRGKPGGSRRAKKA